MRLTFAECVLDTDARQVLRGGTAVHLSPKAYELLRILAEARPRALSKDELYEQLWPETFVVEANLSNLMAEVRSALGDSAHEPRIIRTVHGFGYAFQADGRLFTRLGPRGVSDVTYCLIWNTRRFELVPGDNLIGRDPALEICIDLPSVSRRHARIAVSGAEATIEDLGSKNGTWVGGHKITAPTPLRDRDEIRVGSVAVTFYASAGDQSTETIPGR